jgi:hypothetical protein
MNNPQTSMEQFEFDYSNALAMLAESRPDDEGIDSLLFPEEARTNMGVDGYAPEWIQPFVAVVANLAQDHFMRMATTTGGLTSVIPQAIAPALVRAVQLGYLEGYLSAKDD